MQEDKGLITEGNWVSFAFYLVAILLCYGVVGNIYISFKSVSDKCLKGGLKNGRKVIIDFRGKKSVLRFVKIIKQ